MKRDRISPPYKISIRVRLARKRSDQIKLRYDVAPGNSSLSFVLTIFSRNVSGMFRGLQWLMPCFCNKSSVFCSLLELNSSGFPSILIPRNHLISPFHSILKFCLYFFLYFFICSVSENARIMSFTHTRTYIKLIFSRLT